MLASLLRPKAARKPSEGSGVSPHGRAKYSRFQQEQYHDDETEDGDDGGPGDEEEGDEDGEGELEDDGEDEDQEPLLPIFSSEVLDKLPVYNLTHAIRLIVVQRCETTLSWDQLRSPQISQFLVKPIQQQIRESYQSRATLCALIANCLQFQKEGQLNPGSVGISKTRALICELLAMRLLRDYGTRELIDALSYDFNPLQGMPGVYGAATGALKPRSPAVARISAIEIAIRAQAKRFLAHPVVVQQLEAIWAGNIVFHSAADYLHRPPARQPPHVRQSYGTIQPDNDRPHGLLMHAHNLRRTAALYDPTEASLFKLSRLRVPRYRQLFSTCSFAIMLGLFLAVLIQRSQEITPLEIVFWCWSAGYMLDELVGLTEEGFGLYILSIWNAFDIGILIMFFAYYTLRLYGIVIPTARKRYTANLAYDVLASTAVLLFPRLFSVLDHYRYFSQLLIAFRMMALDLAAILVLILIACSGFFVAFTVAFSNDDFTAPRAAYTLFQILMGFTPAAWDIWDQYNILGKGILTLFLCICHFLIVTILITVLTNSFMAVVQNANEEHQFLFAVNTISMVKSDALFSYIAPANVIGWLLRPLSYMVPFRAYVRFNRTIIKLTHFPLLWSIFLYEYFVLSSRIYEPTDLVEQRGRSSGKAPAFTIRGQTDVFTPPARLREPSVTTLRKDRALDEVFRRPFRGEDPSRTNLSERKQNVMHDWMRGMDDQGGASPPAEQAQSVVDRLETRRPTFMRSKTGDGGYGRRNVSRLSRASVASDPEDLFSSMRGVPKPIREEDEDADDEDYVTESRDDIDASSRPPNLDSDQVTPIDGVADDTQSGAQHGTVHRPGHVGSGAEPTYFDSPHRSSPRSSRPQSRRQSADLLGTSLGRRTSLSEQVNLTSSPPQPRARPPGGRMHHRTISTNTILYSPLEDTAHASQQSPTKRLPAADAAVQSKPPFTKSHRSRSKSPHKESSGPTTAKHSAGTATPGRQSGVGAKRPPTAKTRPILPPRSLHQTAPSLNLAGFLALDSERNRKPSFNAMALDLASDIGDNVYRPGAGALFTGFPASFSTALERAQSQQRAGGGGGSGPRALPPRGRTRPGDAARLGFGFATPATPDGGAGADEGEDDQDDDHDDGSGGGGGAAARGSDGGPSRRMSRIMLARMSTLEQGFREVLQEMRDWRAEGVGPASLAHLPGARTLPGTAAGSVGSGSVVARPGGFGATRRTEDDDDDVDGPRRGSEGPQFVGSVRKRRKGKRRSAEVGEEEVHGREVVGTAAGAPERGFDGVEGVDFGTASGNAAPSSSI